jgi:hypothetical protein
MPHLSTLVSGSVGHMPYSTTTASAALPEMVHSQTLKVLAAHRSSYACSTCIAMIETGQRFPQ